MPYTRQRIAAKIVSALVIVAVTMQCVGRAIRAWEISPVLALLPASIPPILVWYFLCFKRPAWSRTHPDNPFWAAVGDDFRKLFFIIAVFIFLMLLESSRGF